MEFNKVDVENNLFEDIVFYLSTDQEVSGISIEGLSKLTKVDTKTLKQGLSIRGKQLKESLESNSDEGLSIGGKEEYYIKGTFGNKTINIIPSDIVTKIIWYYAIESTRISEDTRNHCKQILNSFVNKGLHQWIKESVGAIEELSPQKLMSQLQDLILTVKKTNEAADKYYAIRSTTKTSMLGLDSLLTDLEEGTEEKEDDKNNPLYLPTEDGYISLEGWLIKEGISLNNSKFRSLAKLVAANYKVMFQEDPKKLNFTLPNGRTKYAVYVYNQKAYPLLRISLTKLFNP